MPLAEKGVRGKGRSPCPRPALEKPFAPPRADLSGIIERYTVADLSSSQSEVPSALAAQTATSRLLVPSFICDIGIFGGLATLRFANDALPKEIWLSVDCDLTVDPMPILPSDLSRRQEELLLLEALYGARVDAAECKSDGGLRLTLSGGRTLCLSPRNEQEDAELWELSTDGTTLVVAMRGGEYALWTGD